MCPALSPKAPDVLFDERLMKTGFLGLNAGLVLMIFTGLLPVGLFQFHASTSVSMWYARSEAFLQQPFLETLRWIRTLRRRGVHRGRYGGRMAGGDPGPVAQRRTHVTKRR